MNKKNDYAEFDLDDILNEFQDPAAREDAAAEEMSSEPASMDTVSLLSVINAISNEQEEAAPEKAEEVPAEEAAAAAEEPASMDTVSLLSVINEIDRKQEEAAPEKAEDTSAEEAAPEEEPEPASMDTVSLISVINELSDKQEEAEETPVKAEAEEEAAPEETEQASAPMDTIRMNDILKELSQEMDAEDSFEEIAEEDISEDPTIRIDDLVNEFTEELPTEEPEEEKEESPAIIYNPRTRLRELKKKLVAGPEKRYYELSEIGVGKLQVAILLNVLIVLLCAGATALFAMGIVPENRLRFIIFTQFLAMLCSALMGSNQMLDGLGELFHGRFTVNTLLSFTFAACCVDALYCFNELRVPCCAAFSLEMTMALWARYQRRSTEMAQMDTLRKAVRLNRLVKVPDYYKGIPGILRRDGEVEDFMDTYSRSSNPEKLQSVYAFVSFLLCIAIAVFAGMLHSVSLAVQVLSTSLLVAVPASFFIATTRPMALLERRLHMVGTVLCGWQGVKKLCGKAAYPLKDEDLFPTGSTKLNGVKFYGDREPNEVLSYATSLICASGGGLEPVFRQMLTSRDGTVYPVANFRDYGNGGIGGEICDEPVLVGNLQFLQDMGVEIPEGTMVNQAVYISIDGQLSAVFAISYAKMRSASAGLVSLCAARKLIPVMIGGDFMLTDSLLREKFSVNTRRVAFPDQETRVELNQRQALPEDPALALTTREDLVSMVYAVTGARALRTATNLGVAIHLIGGILGMLIMLVLAYLGSTELLTPTNVLLYQLVWLVPGVLITEWTRVV